MGHIRANCVILFTFFLVLTSHGVLVAQVTVGSISGSVLDPAGRVIPQAQVVLSDKSHAIVRTAMTDATGSYHLIGLPPTDYTLSVTAQGFAELVRSGVSLPVNTALKLDFTLAVGGPKTRIEVTAPVTSIQTDTGALGVVINQQLTETLPLNRRDFLQLSLLAPGAFPSVQGSELSSYGSVSLEVNGGREEYNNFLLDGVDNNDPYVNRYVVEPAVDSVQEFKMATSSSDAEYGRSAAGQVNIITRRGTNNFHGTAYEYLRNKVLDARNYFDGAGFEKPPYIRNQFGAAVGGPIRRDKTFFFVNTDFFRQRESISQQSLVPTDDERAGKLGALGVTIFNPLTGVPYQGNTIPTGSISPIATDILKLFPEPNLTGSVNNYLGQPVEPENHVQNTFRVDHQLSAKDDLTLRYSMGIVNIFEPYPEGVAGAAPGFGDYVNDHTHNAMVREQHAFGGNAINSVFIGFNRFSRDFLVQNYQTNVGSLWGVSWLNLPARDYGYPSISISGFSHIGDNTGFPNLRHTNTYQIGDNFTLVHGNNTFKIGGEVRKLQLNGHLDELARGSISFFDNFSGSGISDLLLGDPSLGLQSQINNPIRLRSMSYAAYFQDDWKISQKVVLNLGGRYEFNSPATDPKNAMSELDLQTGQIVPVGTNGITDSGIHPDYKNFAPRLGIAWSARPDLVFRAGYGVYYDAGMFIVGSAAYFNPPQFTLNVFFPFAPGQITLQNPFPTNGGFPSVSPNVLSPNIITPYLQQWNVSTEGTLGKRGTLTLSYVGSAGSHLIRASNLNQPLPGPTATQAPPPYPAYGSIYYIQSEASSNYNALQAHFTGRVTSAFSLWASYTYSHSIDNDSAFQYDSADANFPQNSRDIAAERGPSSFDMRQRFVAAYIVTLPHGNRWTRNTEFQGIWTAESGQPFTPLISTDNSNTGNAGSASNAGTDRPNRVGNPYKSGAVAANPMCKAPAGPTRTPTQWFNPCAFMDAPPYTFGDAGRNSLLGPGYGSFDLSLLRRFTLPERATLTLEAEAFNLFNKPNFDLPEAFTDQPTSGQISSASQRGENPRQLQFGARISF